jgi:hypothetical protein
MCYLGKALLGSPLSILCLGSQQQVSFVKTHLLKDVRTSGYEGPTESGEFNPRIVSL